MDKADISVCAGVKLASDSRSSRKQKLLQGLRGWEMCQSHKKNTKKKKKKKKERKKKPTNVVYFRSVQGIASDFLLTQAPVALLGLSFIW